MDCKSNEQELWFTFAVMERKFKKRSSMIFNPLGEKTSRIKSMIFFFFLDFKDGEANTPLHNDADT